MTARGNEEALAVELTRLTAELRASALGKDEVRRLLQGLAAHSDVKRRNAAIWAIVDALERIEAGR